MPRTRIKWETPALKQAFERAVHQLGGLFDERTTAATVFTVMCVILSPDRAANLGLTEDKMPNKLRRERKQAREQLARARHEDLELVPPAPPAAEDEDASANDETAEELAPSGEVEADITGATVTGAAAPVATAGWRVACLVACVAWSTVLFVLVTSDRTLAVAFEAASFIKNASRDFRAALISGVDASSLACAATSETAEAVAIAVFAFAAFAAMQQSSGTVGAASRCAAASTVVGMGLVLLRAKVYPERALCARALLPGANTTINNTSVL